MKQRQRLNLYLPRDGEDLVRSIKHIVADSGETMNAWIFETIREKLRALEDRKRKILARERD